MTTTPQPAQQPFQSLHQSFQHGKLSRTGCSHRVCRRRAVPFNHMDQNPDCNRDGDPENDKNGSGSGLGRSGDSNVTFPDTPDHLLQTWMSNRSIASTVDLSRRFISVLFLSNYCRRAAFAEKILAKIAEEFCISRRLLILSAGIYSKPDDLIPWRVVSAAQQREIDLSDDRPCASFEITDRTYF